MNLLSNNIRTLESNEKQKTKNIGTKPVRYFEKTSDINGKDCLKRIS